MEERSKENKIVSVSDKKAILVVSFGTSYQESRKAAIEAIEKQIAEAFPDYEVRRAFSSQRIIDKVRDREQVKIENVKEAMERLVLDGIQVLIVQPTYIIEGIEYEEMRNLIASYENKFQHIYYGKPIFHEEKDYEKVRSILVKKTSGYNKGAAAVVLVGHGTEHLANAVYAKLDLYFKRAGYWNYYVGTVEAEPSLMTVRTEILKNNYNQVVLFPLMIVAGDHVRNDIAGEGKGSWKQIFQSEGFEITCILKGLGEYPEICELFVEHIKDVMEGKSR